MQHLLFKLTHGAMPQSEQAAVDDDDETSSTSDRCLDKSTGFLFCLQCGFPISQDGCEIICPHCGHRSCPGCGDL